jgi:photosynthetic reaction center H subunit
MRSNAGTGIAFIAMLRVEHELASVDGSAVAAARRARAAPYLKEASMARTIEPNEDGVRIAPLGALDDFEVAEGYPDVRGWKVVSSDGRDVGKVHELLIDVDNLRTRYLDVRLNGDIAATPGERDVLVPIGTANLIEDQKAVRVPLTAERFGLLPLYEHGHLSRVQEVEVRRHFSLGEAAAAGVAGAAAADAVKRDFYDNEGYDDKRFFGERRAPYVEVPGTHRETDRAAADRPVTDRELADRELADRDTERALADRGVRASESEVRVPVERDESVVLRRGESGRDEIIIRRPIAERDDRPR